MAAKKAQEAKNEKKLKITLVKSTISSIERHKKTIEALGLKKIRSTVIQKDNPAIRGMLFHVKHLVSVEEVNE